MIIDYHAHIYPRPFMEEIARKGAPYGVGLERNEAGDEMLKFEGMHFWAYKEHFFNVQQRLALLDEAKVELQVLSMGPPMVYWADPKLALRLCQIMNDEIASLVGQYPTRFIGFAALPFQDQRLAIEELKRAHQSLGLVGVQMGSNIHGKPIDHPDLWPVYEKIEENDLPIFIHPINPLGQPGIHDYRLDLTVGFPFDTTLAAARLIMGGVMERFPGLKICFAHLGGALPFLKERLDIGWRTRHIFPGKRTSIPKPPSEYMKLFYLDVVSCADPALLCALDCSDTDHLVLGSDAPFAVGHLQKSIECVQKFPFFSEADKEKVLYGNAARLLKLL
jgi:aminocarboxymuconate-semialdehyde decarboxylase